MNWRHWLILGDVACAIAILLLVLYLVFSLKGS